jgi:malate dehydrogenase
LAETELADIVLVDIMSDMVQGKALDLLEAMPIIGNDVFVTGTSNFEETKNSDIVVITAGVARKPGMSREDLLVTNAGIVTNAVRESLKYSPEAIFVVLTNPLDTMAYLTLKVGKLPPHRVVGQAGVLDTARMRAFVSMELGVSVENIQCTVLGGHGDEMVPLPRYSSVAGMPLDEIMPADRLAAIVERTRKGGIEVINLLKTGSAYYAPAAAIRQMVEAILKDKHLIVPAAAYMQGEYGLNDTFFGVPVQLGRKGIEKIIEYKLNKKERAAFDKSAASVGDSINTLKKLVKI